MPHDNWMGNNNSKASLLNQFNSFHTKNQNSMRESIEGPQSLREMAHRNQGAMNFYNGGNGSSDEAVSSQQQVSSEESKGDNKYN